MKLSKNMAKTAAITIVLLMASVMLTAMPVQQVKAQLAPQQPVSGPLPAGVTVDGYVDTVAFLSFRPNPVGLNQIFLVNIWTSPSLHAQRFHPNYTVTIMKPNGETEVIRINSYCADATAWFEYIADQEGVWKLKFDFLGTYFPAGRYYNGYIVTNTSGALLGSAYYKPSSTDWQKLVVLKDYVVQSWPESPLPTDYWTRPIPPEYREWWPIAGNFPWFGPGGGPMWDKLYPNTNPYRMGISREPMARFAAWVQAPNTAHVVWKRQNALAGLIGGDVGAKTLEGDPGHPSIILFGRAYQTVTRVSPNGPSSQTYWQCYDIRTGEIYWERPLYPGESEPTLIEYEKGLSEVPGAEPLSYTVRLLYIGNRKLLKYDPWTGALARNYSIAPLSTGKYYMNGYALSVQDLGAAAAPDRYRLINWTTFGTATTLKGRIVSNITWPWSDLGGYQDFYRGIAIRMTRLEAEAVYVDGVRSERGAYFVGTELRAANMKTGKEMWNFTTDLINTSSGAVLVDHGKVAMNVLKYRKWFCWDAYTGEPVWESEEMGYPWGEFVSYSSESAYGMIFFGTYEALYAFNWINGKIVWKFKAPANPYETPFTDENGQAVYSWHSSLYVADGKIFTYTCTHTPEQPITRGWKWYAINATTGKEIWSLPGCGVDSRVFQGAMADGYLAMEDSYSGTLFVVGKGKSQTTVTVSPKTIAKGTTVLIEGAVLDMSPAQPGTPCVSKESMSTWMAHLHWQWPIDGFWHNETITGVPVMLTAIAEDGSYIDIGTVVTDGYSGTFGVAWTPPKEGTYKIVAAFSGDDSYGSSSATTWITVGPAPAEPEMPEIPTPTDYTPMFTALAMAIIVIAILIVYTLYTVRKLARK